jgi:hypothetical protein
MDPLGLILPLDLQASDGPHPGALGGGAGEGGELLDGDSFGSTEPAPLPVEVVVLYDVVFEQFDADHNGAIDPEEFRDEMRWCDGTSPAILAVVAAGGGRKEVPDLRPPVLLLPLTVRRSSRGA